jgi:hypothetical protein
MTSPDALAGRLGLGNRPARISLFHRVLAVVRAPTVDAELAEGVSPSASPAHQLRADHIRRPQTRSRIASALNAAIDDADGLGPYRSPIAPVNREAIILCRRELQALAESVPSAENASTRGLAIASQLVFDGSGALFDPPGLPNAAERLANSIHAARSALRVSAEFDPRHDWRNESWTGKARTSPRRI